MSLDGRVFQISISPGGVPKLAHHRSRVTTLGLVGDGHNAPHHGGPGRALCLYSLERLVGLQEEGHPVFPGSTGENITVSGIDWDLIKPGTVLELGESVEIAVTEYTKPCTKINASFAGADIDRMDQNAYPGWARVYAQVRVEGEVATGDRVRIAEQHGAGRR